MNPFEQFLASLLNSLPATADTAGLDANLDISGFVQGATVLETAEMPAGLYLVGPSIRTITDEGYVACRLDKDDVNGRAIQVYTHDKTSTDAGPCPSGTYLVRLDAPATFKLNYEAGENPVTLTAKETRLTVVRIGA